MADYRLAAVCGAVLALSSCSGTTPSVNGRPIDGISAVLLGGKIVLPTGESGEGRILIDFEGEPPPDGRLAPEIYELAARAQQPVLYQIEPGSYHYAPPRSFFGKSEPELIVQADGQTYRAPFPRDILRRPSLRVRPSRILALGILTAELQRALPGRRRGVRVTLDDSLATRRKLVQDMIHDMMDPKTPQDVRDSAVAWAHPLDQSLEELSEERVRPAPYRPGP